MNETLTHDAHNSFSSVCLEELNISKPELKDPAVQDNTTQPRTDSKIDCIHNTHLVPSHNIYQGKMWVFLIQSDSRVVRARSNSDSQLGSQM